jgi:glycosyltransferase involved in cell wall biosynthesis
VGKTPLFEFESADREIVSARVSILLPVWNAEATLATALRSVERQSETRWECIIVDDGSTDRSHSIAASFVGRDPRFRLVSRDHAGLIPTLNAGIALCDAPLVARMDADDWMHRDRLRRQCAALELDSDLEAVGCFVRIFPRRGLSEGRLAYERWLLSLADAQTIWRDRFIECPIAHPTLMIRRDRLERLEYRERGWPEDYDLILRLLRAGPVVGTVPERLHGWRDLPSRLSRTDPRYDLARFTDCRAWHLSRDFLGESGEYLLWGHGRTGRALRGALSRLGHRVTSIVEVHPRRIGNTIHGAPVVSPHALETRPPYPIVVSVAGSGPRGEIRAALDKMGFREGLDYVCAA